jgi:hypothetical protein
MLACHSGESAIAAEAFMNHAGSWRLTWTIGPLLLHVPVERDLPYLVRGYNP